MTQNRTHNCGQLRAEDIREILGQVLLEFPVT